MKKFISGMLLGGLIIGCTAYISKSGYDVLIDTKDAQIERLERQISDLTVKNDEYLRDITFRESWQSLGEFKITYYWPGEDEWGDKISRPCCNNHRAIEGHTISVDPTIIPYGTEVLIDGEIYVAEDCGSAVKGNVIDIYVENPKEEMYYSQVYVRKGGNYDCSRKR